MHNEGANGSHQVQLFLLFEIEIHLHFLCSNSDNRQGGGGILQLCVAGKGGAFSHVAALMFFLNISITLDAHAPQDCSSWVYVCVSLPSWRHGGHKVAG